MSDSLGYAAMFIDVELLTSHVGQPVASKICCNDQSRPDACVQQVVATLDSRVLARAANLMLGMFQIA